jgi:hypothetical protein
VSWDLPVGAVDERALHLQADLPPCRSIICDSKRHRNCPSSAAAVLYE